MKTMKIFNLMIFKMYQGIGKPMMRAFNKSGILLSGCGFPRISGETIFLRQSDSNTIIHVFFMNSTNRL